MELREKIEARMSQYLRLLAEAAQAAARGDQELADKITAAAQTIGRGNITSGMVFGDFAATSNS